MHDMSPESSANKMVPLEGASIALEHTISLLSSMSYFKSMHQTSQFRDMAVSLSVEPFVTESS
jgi:hypothetical protein